VYSSSCNAWFRSSRKDLPRPIKPPDMIFQDTTLYTANDPYLSSGGRTWPSVTGDSLVRLRNERRGFKNVCVYISDLPPTPSFFPLKPPPSCMRSLPTTIIRRVNVHAECGRHTDDWLFGSFPLVSFLKRSIRHGWFHRSGGDHH